MKNQILIVVTLFAFTTLLEAQYISEVLEYKPAPGQFINSAPWGVPASANSLVGKITGTMSLGAFGGYVIFKFVSPVKNDPDNPFGVDFTIFGNPLREWSEQGIVSVMKDENGNGLPDDIWYELAGSDYFFSSTIKNYEITYTNPKQASAADVPWTDNQGNSGKVLKNAFHSQPYYPENSNFPLVNQKDYTLTGTRVADEVDRTNPSYIKSYRKAFGYVDNQVRGSAPYTLPDNPYTREKENSGGDAFDISWAVNANGNYVDLDQIDFIKVHNAVIADAGWLGEVSTEVTGAVVVTPDASVTGVTDMVVIKHLPGKITTTTYQLEVAAFVAGRYQANRAITWQCSNSNANIDANNVLLLNSSCNGKLTVTASFSDNTSVSATASTTVNVVSTGLPEYGNSGKPIIYPNPASGYIVIEGVEGGSVYIFSITGELELIINSYSHKNRIDIGALSNGVHIVKILNNDTERVLRFIKK